MPNIVRTAGEFTVEWTRQMREYRLLQSLKWCYPAMSKVPEGRKGLPPFHEGEKVGFMKVRRNLSSKEGKRSSHCDSVS